MPRVFLYKALCGIFLLGTLVRCSDREVLLPLIPVEGLPEIQNHSSIWIFFEVNGQDTIAVLNKNNKMINTNWIFNVDRRLSMKQVIPELQKMQADRNKDSMHKKEGMENFFSYADTQNQRISLISFPETEYVAADSSANDSSPSVDKLVDRSSCLIPVEILGKRLRVNGKRIEAEQAAELTTLLPPCDSTRTSTLQLFYSTDLSYQDYLSARAYLAAAGLPLHETEVIVELD